MRIISKFKDYYDSALAYGSEDEPLYVRETKSTYNHRPYDSWENNMLGGNSCNPGCVYFCGVAFPFVKIGAHYYYSLDSVDKLANSLSSKEKEWYYSDHEIFYRDRGAAWRKGLRRRWFGEKLYHKDYLAPKSKWSRNYLDVRHLNGKAKEFCETNECPVIVWFRAGGEIITEFNPKLADYEFIRVKDPFTAFQEISMWLSNRANNEDKVPQLSNTDMIVSKGFDLKTSFRKPKWDKHEK